mmetsp:Transcript_121871/g.351863  ORF Transcript_121871/g.351863 Transcript_121871/m.351863 type:complete len:236 (-) Transcript_121871:2303-3010(-)
MRARRRQGAGCASASATSRIGRRGSAWPCPTRLSVTPTPTSRCRTAISALPSAARAGPSMSTRATSAAPRATDASMSRATLGGTTERPSGPRRAIGARTGSPLTSGGSFRPAAWWRTASAVSASTTTPRAVYGRRSRSAPSRRRRPHRCGLSSASPRSRRRSAPWRGARRRRSPRKQRSARRSWPRAATAATSSSSSTMWPKRATPWRSSVANSRTRPAISSPRCRHSGAGGTAS